MNLLFPCLLVLFINLLFASFEKIYEERGKYLFFSVFQVIACLHCSVMICEGESFLTMMIFYAYYFIGSFFLFFFLGLEVEDEVTWWHLLGLRPSKVDLKSISSASLSMIASSAAIYFIHQ